MARPKRKPMRRTIPVDIQPPPRAKRPESLTLREQEILELIWAGFKNKEIGQRLKISVKTVATLRRRVRNKLGCRTDVGIALAALRAGVVDR